METTNYCSREGQIKTLSDWYSEGLDRFGNDMAAATAYVEGLIDRGAIVGVSASGRTVEVVTSDADYFAAGIPRAYSASAQDTLVARTCGHRHNTISQADKCTHDRDGREFTQIYHFRTRQASHR